MIPKFLVRQVWTNNVYSDQTEKDLHCLSSVIMSASLNTVLFQILG